MKKRSDGYYRASRTIGGIRFEARSKNRSDATKKLNKKIEEYYYNISAAPTFNEIADEWVEEKWETFTYGTKNCYRASIERARELFGKMEADKVTPIMIDDLLKSLKSQNYSQKTVKTQKSVLSTIYRNAIKNGHITENPATVVEIPKGLPKEIREPPSDSDIEKIKNAKDKWIYPFLLLYTGCRRGEALALTYEDFDFENNTINIDKQIIFESNVPLVEHRTKTDAGKRKIPLLAPLKERIDPNGKGPLFNDITLRRFKTIWANYCKELGITCTPHQLRHAFCTMLYDAGLFESDLKLCQKILGHSEVKMTTDVYTHIKSTKIDIATNSLNSFLAR